MSCDEGGHVGCWCWWLRCKVAWLVWPGHGATAPADHSVHACSAPTPSRPPVPTHPPTPHQQGMDVALVCDGSGAGRGGGEKKDVLPPLMPGLPARQQS